MNLWFFSPLNYSFLISAPKYPRGKEVQSKEGRLLALKFPQRGRKSIFLHQHRGHSLGWERDAASLAAGI